MFNPLNKLPIPNLLPEQGGLIDEASEAMSRLANLDPAVDYLQAVLERRYGSTVVRATAEVAPQAPIPQEQPVEPVPQPEATTAIEDERHSREIAALDAVYRAHQEGSDTHEYQLGA